MQYPGREKEIIEYYKQNPNYMNSIKGPIFENKVMKFISEEAKVIEKNITSDDLLKKVSANEEVNKKNEKKGKNAK